MAKMQAKNSADERDDGLREKMIAVNRVTKVVKGGRILSFVALVVVGDGNGRIGMGKGRAKEVPVAVQKAMDQARRSMFKVSIKDGTLHHSGRGKHGASEVILSPGKEGMICSPGLRSVFYVAGIQNVVAKSIGSTNPYNLVRALLDALKKQFTPSEVAAKRGKSLQAIFE